MSKHTPGPWAEIEGAIYALGGKVAQPCDGWGAATEEANARLIASAPEMLEALKDWLQLADEAVRNYGEDMVHPKERGVIRSARAAIAKAEGRT